MLIKTMHRAIKTIIPVFDISTIPALNQPNNGDIQVLSDNSGDTQAITLYGIDNADVFKTHTIVLNGTSAVDSVLNPKWKYLYGAFLGDIYGNISKRATGTITIRKKTGGGTIATIAATKLSQGMIFFDVAGHDILIENIEGNTWFNTKGIASTTGASGLLSGRMAIETLSQKYVSMISDSASTVQIYVLEV